MNFALEVFMARYERFWPQFVVISDDLVNGLSR